MPRAPRCRPGWMPGLPGSGTEPAAATLIAVGAVASVIRRKARPRRATPVYTAAPSGRSRPAGDSMRIVKALVAGLWVVQAGLACAASPKPVTEVEGISEYR